MARLPSALRNILKCASGNHRNCKQLSLVCKHHKYPDSPLPRSLPYRQYIQLNQRDLNTIQAKIDTYFSRQKLQLLHLAFNTNKVESKHHRAQTYCPKMTTYKRNTQGLCASAVQSDTFETGASTKRFARLTGMKVLKDGPFTNLMQTRDGKAKYDRQRQQLQEYKTARYRRLLHKVQRTVREKASTLANTEHLYTS